MAYKITIGERIATRAYYMHLNGAAGSSVDHWLAAEAIELAAFAKRQAAARKGAETKRTGLIAGHLTAKSPVANVMGA